MKDKERKFFEKLAALLAVLTLLTFAIVLLHRGTAQNIATWASWTVLDFVLFWAMRKAGNDAAWLMFGYGIGALAVTLSLLHTGAYAFGRLEVGILLSCAVAYLIGRKYPRISVVMSVATMVIAGSGLIVDMWVAPARSTWWFWMLCTFSSGLSVYALSRDWKKTIEDALPPVASTAYNFLIFLLVVL